MDASTLNKQQQQKQPIDKTTNNPTRMEPLMETDPIDGGPLPNAMPTPAVPTTRTTTTNNMPLPSTLLSPVTLTQEEQAKQVIEQLRAEDMAQRVTAAHRLPAAAAVLGPERTRMVSEQLENVVLLSSLS